MKSMAVVHLCFSGGFFPTTRLRVDMVHCSVNSMADNVRAASQSVVFTVACIGLMDDCP